LNEIKKPLQDGEKYEMLCDCCEQKFSTLEAKFANDFFDVYLQSEIIPKVNPNYGWLSNYCLSVTWRILYDDLNRMDSYKNSWHRSIFEQFESILHQHLNSGVISDEIPKKIENYIFKLSEIVKGTEYADLLQNIIFGYSYFDATNKIFVVYSYYAGLIFATRNFPKDFFLIGGVKSIFLQYFRTKKWILRKSLTSELTLKSKEIANKYKQVMTPELIEKIKNFYTGK
jgi:hypothetical protein